MNTIPQQFEYVHQLIGKIITNHSDIKISVAANAIYQHIVNNQASPYLANEQWVMENISKDVVRLACEETRMELADEFRRIHHPALSLHFILDTVSDTSLTLIYDFLEYLQHFTPNDDKMNEDMRKRHTPFLSMSAGELNLIISFSNNFPTLSMGHILKLFCDLPEKEFQALMDMDKPNRKLFNYYTDNLKFPVEEALYLIANKPNQTQAAQAEKLLQEMNQTLAHQTMSDAYLPNGTEPLVSLDPQRNVIAEPMPAAGSVNPAANNLSSGNLSSSFINFPSHVVGFTLAIGGLIAAGFLLIGYYSFFKYRSKTPVQETVFGNGDLANAPDEDFGKPKRQ